MLRLFIVVVRLDGQALLLAEPAAKVYQAASFTTKRSRFRLLQIKLLATNGTNRKAHAQVADATAVPFSLFDFAPFSAGLALESAGLSDAAAFL